MCRLPRRSLQSLAQSIPSLHFGSHHARSALAHHRSRPARATSLRLHWLSLKEPRVLRFQSSNYSNLAGERHRASVSVAHKCCSMRMLSPCVARAPVRSFVQPLEPAASAALFRVLGLRHAPGQHLREGSTAVTSQLRRVFACLKARRQSSSFFFVRCSKTAVPDTLQAAGAGSGKQPEQDSSAEGFVV